MSNSMLNVEPASLSLSFCSSPFSPTKKNLFVFFYKEDIQFIFLMFIFERERERKRERAHVNEEGPEREGDLGLKALRIVRLFKNVVCIFICLES